MLHVFHHNDPDGKCAAAIVHRHWYKVPNGGWNSDSFRYIETDYKDPVDTEALKMGDTVVIVDYSFKRDVMLKTVEKVGWENIFWMDHHKTAFEYDYGFIPKGLRNANFAGCELTWKFLNPDVAIPMGVILIGDYDIWTHRYGELTENYFLGIQLYDLSPVNSSWDLNVLNASDNTIDSIAEQGQICKLFRNNFCRQYIKDFGFEVEFEGYKCFAVGMYEFGSKVFGYLIDEYDLCLSFEYDGKGWQCGVYSSNSEINCGKIAQKYGGGGHPGAAGFPCKKLPWMKGAE